ncbi:MAG: ABC transporter [Phycisphaerales bacterium JB038]
MSRPTVTLRLEQTLATAVRPSSRVLQVAAMFGLGVEEERVERLIPPTKLRLGPGRIIFVQGPSGSGKSTLLRLIEAAAPGCPAMRLLQALGGVEESEAPLVEQLGETLAEATSHLALAGLGDAFVMLRSPQELSDGQRYRWQLAKALHEANRVDEAHLPVVLADEFAATLDRRTACLLARSLRRFVTKTQCCVVAATTHDDLLEGLAPDVLVHKPLGEAIEVLER